MTSASDLLAAARTLVGTPNERDLSEETHPVSLTACTRPLRAGGRRRRHKGERPGTGERRDLGEFLAPARGMLFDVGKNPPKEQKVVGGAANSLICGNSRTSLRPSLHTHGDSPTAQLFTSGKGIWYLQSETDYYYSMSRLKAGEVCGGHILVSFLCRATADTDASAM